MPLGDHLSPRPMGSEMVGQQPVEEVWVDSGDVPAAPALCEPHREVRKGGQCACVDGANTEPLTL
eukprot:6128929-Prorocentrum_lima.AAC.1